MKVVSNQYAAPLLKAKCNAFNKTRRHEWGGRPVGIYNTSSQEGTVVDFLSMRGTTVKILELNQHLQQNKTDIFGEVDLFLSSDDKILLRFAKSCWYIGKCSKIACKTAV